MSASMCTLVGLLDDVERSLSPAARDCLARADVVIGAARTLELVRPLVGAEAQLRSMDGALGQSVAWVREAAAAGQRAVVLATGDPLCHGIGGFLGRQLGREALEIMPAVSTVQLAFARLGLPWQEARIASVHGKDCGEWVPFVSTPEHTLHGLLQAVGQHRLVAAFTSPANSPQRIARALLGVGYEDGMVRVSVASRLALPDEAVVRGLSLSEAAGREFAEPNVVVLERLAEPAQPVFGLEDEAYHQRAPEKGLITKQEVRALSLALLRLRETSVVWDIGAGSGSVGLEAARVARGGHVWAVEKNEGDMAIARENARAMRAANYTLVHGRAPEPLADWPDPDAVFIGGSGGELRELVALVAQRLRPGGALVMNFVTLENLATAQAALEACGLPWRVTQLSAARSQPILNMHRLAAQNPVWLVSAHKPLEEEGVSE